MVNRKQVDVLYADFTKALDTINHEIFLKFSNIGLAPQVPSFLQS